MNVPSHCRVGRYGVNLHDLDGIGVQAIRRAMDAPDVEVVVVDEIGKMEVTTFNREEMPEQIRGWLRDMMEASARA